MNANGSFLFVCCQPGAESSLKKEIARNHPPFRFAYSRRGFVTFKWDDARPLSSHQTVRSVFSRCHGVSLGSVEGDNAHEMARQFWRLAQGRSAGDLHVWSRETQVPGDRGFEPGESAIASEIGQVLTDVNACLDEPRTTLRINQKVQPGHEVLDCVLIDPGHWWVGYHRAIQFASRWPGGVPVIETPDSMISRAYLKMAESLAWSRLPVRKNDPCVEIGSAPGGASQAMLDRGLRVTGIDPAKMDPAIMDHAGFTHIRKRGRDLKRREYAPLKWVSAASNVASQHSLGPVGDIVTHSAVHIRGMLLTLKLTDWKLAESIPDYIQRVKSWGFQHVRVRQLAHNRQEVCLAAVRRKFLLRDRPTKRPAKRKNQPPTESDTKPPSCESGQ